MLVGSLAPAERVVSFIAEVMPLRNLARSATCNHASDPAHADERSGIRTYRWMQFEGKEHVTEFDDSHFEMEGRFESHSSAGHKEYQARIRTITLRKQGKGKMDIAQILGRSERFVGKWWQKEEQEVPKPWGVHGFLGGEMGFEAVQSGAVIGDDTATDAATWWRDVEIRRRFVNDPAIYKEIMENAAWEGLPSNTKDFKTGAAVMKYMKDGSVCIQSYQKAKYSPGLSPATDKALQKLFAEFGIEGRTVGVLLNRYDDGQAMLGSHRHDCWTALFSFGNERILTIDHTPLLCQDGDLIIFGTQRHGVPKMPEITTGRVTVVVFFYPNQLQKQKMWQTVADEDGNAPSRTLVAIQHDTMLGSSAQEWALWGFGGKGYKSLAHLKSAGLLQSESDTERAKADLIRHEFDTELVAAIMIRGSSTLKEMLEEHVRAFDGSVPRSRWGRRSGLEIAAKQTISDTSGQDSEFCVRVLKRIAEGFELPELDDQQLPTGQRGVFKAEDWDGVSGDLVAHFLRGGNVQLKELDSMIKLEDMSPAELVSVGAGNLSERDFFDILRKSNVTTLYDLRASESQRDMRAGSVPLPHFSVKNLRISCKARGLLYKHMAIGRESAYGVLAHLQSAEGQHTLLELVWQAQRSCTAFLGSELDWCHDARLAIAEALSKAGHTVHHWEANGELRRHEAGQPFPDWLLREEEKLRQTEKMRHAGELQRKSKSSVDRSTESVALKSMQKPVEVDTMSMLREATNQQELKFAQRHLAAMQRYSDKYELPSKVLSGTPQFILEEARVQAAWVEERAKQKDKANSSSIGTASSKSDTHDDDVCDFQVECRVCNHFYSWSALAAGDGCCSACSVACAASGAHDQKAFGAGSTLKEEVVESGESGPTEDLFVECTGCGKQALWSLLAFGDGKCPACTVQMDSEVEEAGALFDACPGKPCGQALVAHPAAACSSGRWQRHVSRDRQ